MLFLHKPSFNCICSGSSSQWLASPFIGRSISQFPIQTTSCRRIALSYGKTEFIRMCSFNGQQCDIINDFKLHVDPAFGNCYTFNVNRDRPLISTRAGPSYGLRLLVYVNSSDYLPTTQASGVRIAIHAADEMPFPDSFGYSAPTDSLSSFGLSLVWKFSRCMKWWESHTMLIA